MKREMFIKDIMEFGLNKDYYQVEDCPVDELPGVVFKLKCKSDVRFIWRDYEIELMPITVAIDIGYCLSRAVDLRLEIAYQEEDQDNG